MNFHCPTQPQDEFSICNCKLGRLANITGNSDGEFTNSCATSPSMFCMYYTTYTLPRVPATLAHVLKPRRLRSAFYRMLSGGRNCNLTNYVKARPPPSGGTQQLDCALYDRCLLSELNACNFVQHKNLTTLVKDFPHRVMVNIGYSAFSFLCPSKITQTKWKRNLF
jgi:hypothetical protein